LFRVEKKVGQAPRHTLETRRILVDGGASPSFSTRSRQGVEKVGQAPRHTLETRRILVDGGASPSFSTRRYANGGVI
jgi:hypothetical protein